MIIDVHGHYTTAPKALEDWRNRRVVTVAMNILHGAAVLLRAQMLRSQGVRLPPGVPSVGAHPGRAVVSSGGV